MVSQQDSARPCDESSNHVNKRGAASSEEQVIAMHLTYSLWPCSVPPSQRITQLCVQASDEET